jgi:hypothetical protein
VLLGGFDFDERASAVGAELESVGFGTILVEHEIVLPAGVTGGGPNPVLILFPDTGVTGRHRNHLSMEGRVRKSVHDVLFGGCD